LLNAFVFTSVGFVSPSLAESLPATSFTDAEISFPLKFSRVKLNTAKFSVTVLVSTATPSLYKVISFKPEEIPGSWAVTTTSISSLEKVHAPFKTIAKARDVVRTVNGNMKSDIYVYLRGGTYNITETITFGPQDSGTNGYRIYYMAYPGETPVLSGATKVTGWTRHNGNIYKAKLNRSTKLRNLYVNDQRASMTSKRVTARGDTELTPLLPGRLPGRGPAEAKATVFGMICRKYRKLPAIKMTLR